MKASRVVAGLLFGGLLCGTALAGHITVHVIDGGGPVPGAKVSADGFSGTTDASGRCDFHQVPAGKYTVYAEKVFPNWLFAAVHRDLVVNKEGWSGVLLRLSKAIKLNEYMPLTFGAYWLYSERIERPGEKAKLRPREEKVVETGTFKAGSLEGQPYRVLMILWPGQNDWIWDVISCTTDGFVRYKERDGPEGDDTHYVPPLRFPNLFLLLQPIEVECTISRTGAGSEPFRVVANLQKFETVTVPAGTFPNCARISFERTVGTVEEAALTWFAKGVGKVKSIETKPDYTSIQLLEKYQLRLPVVPKAVHK